MNRSDVAFLAKLAAIVLAALLAVQSLALLYCVALGQNGFPINESNSSQLFDAKAKKCDALQDDMNGTLVKILDLSAGFLAGKTLK